MDPKPNNPPPGTNNPEYFEKKKELEQDVITFRAVIFGCTITMLLIALIHILITFAVPCSASSSYNNYSPAFHFGGRNISPALMAGFTLFLAGSSTSVEAGKDIIKITVYL